ncbi:hypothetical protein EMPG_14914 [Blastomyces silverae]|uniref:Uncharacterized protein n=1 Tax=Blastomyces silverae TaxID=2060906 RepID=A0A0H1BDV6_9EURO|nr:hypothetical protein EMPG_14914 [Blastomyces silverae]
MEDGSPLTSTILALPMSSAVDLLESPVSPVYGKGMTIGNLISKGSRITAPISRAFTMSGNLMCASCFKSGPRLIWV